MKVLKSKMENKLNIRKEFEKLNFDKKSLENRIINFNKFINSGFPTKKEEAWKFSDLKNIVKNNIEELKFFNEKLSNVKNEKLSEEYLPKNLGEFNSIELVNGIVKKINLEFEDMNSIKIDIVKNYKTSFSENNLVQLNNALYFENLNVVIKQNYSFKKPLVLFNYFKNNIYSTNINQKINIKLENNSTLSLINIFCEKSNSNFINVYNNYYLCENAVLKNYIIDANENNNLKYLYSNIDLDKNSVSENFIYSAGSKFAKHEVLCNLKDKYSSAFINGIINLDKDKHHEIQTKINHLNENTKSYQLVKSVLKDKSKGVYQGKIYVDSTAQKTDGYQLSKAVLLNSENEFSAKPELEIYADDVKCSHGSTSGNLDENKIFYLMTRGLSYRESKNLLIEGFLTDVIDKITNQHVKKIVFKILKDQNEHR